MNNNTNEIAALKKTVTTMKLNIENLASMGLPVDSLPPLPTSGFEAMQQEREKANTALNMMKLYEGLTAKDVGVMIANIEELTAQNAALIAEAAINDESYLSQMKQIAFLENENDKLRAALQAVVDSTDGANGSEWFNIMINAIKKARALLDADDD